MASGDSANDSGASEVSRQPSSMTGSRRVHRRRRRPAGFDTDVAANFANATKLALVSIDATGTIRFVNPAATSLFGYDPEEMLGQPVEIIIP